MRMWKQGPQAPGEQAAERSEDVGWKRMNMAAAGIFFGLFLLLMCCFMPMLFVALFAEMAYEWVGLLPYVVPAVSLGVVIAPAGSLFCALAAGRPRPNSGYIRGLYIGVLAAVGLWLVISFVLTNLCERDPDGGWFPVFDFLRHMLPLLFRV